MNVVETIEQRGVIELLFATAHAEEPARAAEANARLRVARVTTRDLGLTKLSADVPDVVKRIFALGFESHDLASREVGVGVRCDVLANAGAVLVDGLVGLALVGVERAVFLVLA